MSAPELTGRKGLSSLHSLRTKDFYEIIFRDGIDEEALALIFDASDGEHDNIIATGPPPRTAIPIQTDTGIAQGVEALSLVLEDTPQIQPEIALLALRALLSEEITQSLYGER